MRRKVMTAFLVILLVCSILAGCGRVTPVPAQTDAPTAEPAIRETASPTPEPTPEPAPEATPEPTAEPSAEPTPEATPEPVPVASLPEGLADSGWWLYAFETEGYVGDPWEDGTDNWLEFYPDDPMVNYYERMWDDEWTVLRGARVMEDAGGNLCFGGEVDGTWMDFTLTVVSEWELELSVAWTNPDGTPGGGTRWFNRASGVQDGREMGPGELDAFLAQLGPTDWGFFHDTYAYPQEIHWDRIGAGGLGIAADVPWSEEEDWRRYYDVDDYAEPVGLMQQDLETLAREKTGTDYNEGENRILWWYWNGKDNDPWVGAYDPVYAEEPNVYYGYMLGNRCRLVFSLSNDPAAKELGLEFRAYTVTLYQSEAGWQFYSCIVQGQVEPEVLASVRFFETREDARRETGVNSFIATEHLDSDEPNWVWAVVEAQTDGVQYDFWRANMEYEEANAFEALIGAKMRGKLLSSGVLDKGGKVALEVNLAWYPRLRLELSKEFHWAEYWFGDDNYIHLDPYTATRYIAGHDLDGEGRGCNPTNEQELVNVLTDRTWLYTDQLGEQIVACLLCYPDGEVDIIFPDTWYSLQAELFRMYAEEYEAPDAVRITVSPNDWYDWSGVPAVEGEPTWIGDYEIYLSQTKGQQDLFLYQIGDTGYLGEILPGTAEGQTYFGFTRFMGTTPYEPVG